MTEKLHLTDAEMQTNVVPWYFLDDNTRARFRAWPHGVQFLRTYGGGWANADEPSWNDGYVYRSKPAPLTQDTVPWWQIPKWATVYARDASGLAFVFECNPIISAPNWIHGGRRARIDDCHVGYQRGTCHWKDSLQRRPEGV